jgi:hypothetical protein
MNSKQVGDMSEEDDDSVREPVEKTCKICGREDRVENMIDCSKYAEDMEEKGIAPGWIDEDCCEQSFMEDPEECIGGCCEERLFQNIEEHFEDCVDVEELTRTERHGVPGFLSKEKTLLITPQIDEFLESLKPLTIVTDIFVDNEGGKVYVKDNQKNINTYSLTLYKEIESRFSSFTSWKPENFITKDGPFCVVYRFNGTSIGAMISPRVRDEENLEETGIEVASKYRERYLEAEEFFGVALKPHEEEIKAIIQGFCEGDLIVQVLCPLLDSLGFNGVKPISFHGPGESGGDFYPFYKTNEFGKIVYYSAQAKAVKINATAGAKEGNVNQLIDQMKKLFRTPFKSFIDNSEKRISNAFIFCSHDFTPEARDQLFHEIENRQTISLVDIDDIARSVLDRGLADRITQYYRKRKGKADAETQTPSSRE